MSAYENARLVLKGTWGDSRRALKIAHVSKTALLMAQKRGDLQNLMLFGDQSGTQDDDDKSVLAAGLNFHVVFPDGYNDKHKWDLNTSGTEPYFDGYANLFESNALGYEKTATSAASFTSQAMSAGGFPLLKNAAFAVRVYIPKPPGFAVFTLAKWGAAGTAGSLASAWQLQLIDGTLFIMRLAPTWAQSDEDTLHGLQALENPNTTQQGQMDALKSTLYLDYTPLGVFGGKDDWYGTRRMLVLIPEPRGLIRLWDGARWAKARHSAILKSRENNVLWLDSRLTVATSGPPLYWQAGYPLFAPSGELRFSQYRTPKWMDVTTIFNYNAVQSAGGTLTGTNIEFGNVVGLVWAHTRATFTTTNTRYTPFLYAFSAFVPAGGRSGDTATAWDSDDADFADVHGISPILDVQPQFEGENKRRSYTILVRDVSGSTFELLGGNYDSGQWRVCDYYEGGAKLISNGLVRQAEFGDMRNTTYNQVRRDVAGPAGVVTLEVSDQWAVLDNHILIEDPIGDGLRVGGHVRQVLNLPGIPDAEFTAVGSTAGRPCGAALAGEDWKTRPTPGVSAGDYLRGYVKRKGNGRVLSHEGTGWKLAYRDNTLLSIGGHDADFTTDADLNDPRSYPGRFAILQRLNLTFDWSDYANEFVVIGAEDENGERITQIARINRAINPLAAIPLRAYVGIVRRMYVECPDSSTLAEVALDRRSITLEYGQPPRFSAFETYYHRNFTPGGRINVDGTPARISRVSDGSWAEDKMIICYRELENTTPPHGAF